MTIARIIRWYLICLSENRCMLKSGRRIRAKTCSACFSFAEQEKRALFLIK